MHFCIDTFSGSVADLKPGRRTEENIIAVLRRDPLVSCWDLSEHAWLRNRIYDMVKRGVLVEDRSQSYPWCKFTTAA